MAIVNPLKSPRTSDPKELSRFYQALADSQSYITYAGNPTGTVNPRWLGDKCFDTTGQAWYLCPGLTAADWVAANAGEINIDQIADWAITASKLWLNIPVVQGLTLTNNNPGAGSVSWAAFSIYYAGAKYDIAASNTDKKYIYWKDLASTISTSDTNPSGVAGWAPQEDFIIAVNISGVGQQAWSGIANQVIGDAFIENVNAAKLNAGTLVVGSGSNEVDSITVNDGGDISLYGDASNPGEIKFYDPSSALISKISSKASTITNWYPEGSTTNLYIGEGSGITPWNSIYLKGIATSIKGYYDDYNYASISVAGGVASSGYNTCTIVCEDNDTAGSYVYDYLDFYPYEHKTHDCGKSEKAWDDVYADDFQNVADFFHLDDHDDLAIINAIKPSGQVDPRTGLPMIDDDTLPDFMLTKNKNSSEILRDPDGKPYLSTKMVNSLLMGACRQLDAKIKELSDKIEKIGIEKREKSE